MLLNIGITENTNKILHNDSKIKKARRKDAILEENFDVSKAYKEIHPSYLNT
jgi:hypothetical protein